MATDVSLHPFPLWLNLLLRVLVVNRLQGKAMCVSHLMLTTMIVRHRNIPRSDELRNRRGEVAAGPMAQTNTADR